MRPEVRHQRRLQLPLWQSRQRRPACLREQAPCFARARGGTAAGRDKNQLFAPALLEEYKREVARLLAEEKRRQHPNTEQARAELAQAEREIENLLVAIKAGILTPTTKAELEKAEAERDRALATLHVDTRAVDKMVAMLPRAVDRYKALVADLGATAQRNIPRARAQVKALVMGRVLLHPTDQGYLEAEMAGDPARLLKLVANGANSNLRGSGGRI